MAKGNKADSERFIKVIFSAASIADAARELGVSRQAVSARLQRWKDSGVTGLPEFDKSLDTDLVQEIVNKHRNNK
jgi:transposase